MPFHPIDIHVGTRMRARRILQGITQEGLGDSIGLTFQQIQKYEKGANRMGASRLYEISKKLDVNISYFFEEIDDGIRSSAGDTGASPIIEFIQSTDGIKLAEAIIAIEDKSARRALLKLVRTMAGFTDEED